MTDNRISEVRTTQKEPERERRIFTFKATQLVWLLLGILEAMILLRIGLKLIGANPNSQIVALIYGFTNLFLVPFKGLVGSPTSRNYGAGTLIDVCHADLRPDWVGPSKGSSG